MRARCRLHLLTPPACPLAQMTAGWVLASEQQDRRGWGACAYSQQRELKQRKHQVGLGCASECASSGSLPRWLRPVTHAAAASPCQPERVSETSGGRSVGQRVSCSERPRRGGGDGGRVSRAGCAALFTIHFFTLLITP